MKSLDNLNKRLNYHGGNAEGRFQADKLRGLKKALLYSYQACTLVLPDEREFRCLINPNNQKNEYDNKILSIPYYDICLNDEAWQENHKPPSEDEEEIDPGMTVNPSLPKTSDGLQEVGIKCGDVVKWKETDSWWIVYLQKREEDAYFRAEIRRCDYTTKING